MITNNKIKLFEAFSGIGSQHQALLNLGYKVDIVGISDWYVDAIIAYGIKFLNLKPKKIDKLKVVDYLENYSLSLNSKSRAKSISRLSDDKLSIIYQVIQKYGNLDINKLSGDFLVGKDIDLFTYSFPCQDISQQGLQRGFSKGITSRSGLLWQVERILKEIKFLDRDSLPKILMMENVKAILNKNFKGDLDLWIDELKKLGYSSTQPFVVDASDLGQAQKRQRVFMLSFLGDIKPRDFEITSSYRSETIFDIFEKNMYHEAFKTDKKYNIVEKPQNKGIKKAFLENYTNFNRENYIYYLDDKTPTITSSGAHSRIKIFDKSGDIIYLNAFEHLKLQGFTDKKFYKKLVDIGLSESKIKYLAGNSINIKVLEEIFKYYL